MSIFHVISYQVTNSDVRSVFDCAAQHLPEGGIFLFDIWYSPAVYMQKPSVRVKRMQDDRVEIIRLAEPDVVSAENRVNIKYTILATDRESSVLQAFSETHAMRHFSLPEIDLLAEAAGFRRLVAEEFITCRAPSEDTWGVCVVLEKAANT